MKAMIFSDLITSKNAFVQLLLISIVICGFLAWGTSEVIVGTAAMATMAPLMYLFSIFAYDEMKDVYKRQMMRLWMMPMLT